MTKIIEFTRDDIFQTKLQKALTEKFESISFRIEQYVTTFEVSIFEKKPQSVIDKIRWFCEGFYHASETVCEIVIK